MNGNLRVLVGYATAAGSTREIAERIAAGLRTVAGEVVVRPADPDLDVSGFDAFVIGSALHDQCWLPAALHFLRRHRATLADRPLWCFTVGGVAPAGRVRRRLARLEVERVARAFPAGLALRDHRFFGGVVALEGVPLWGRLFWLAVGGRPGDHRNWAEVERWAAGIATELATLPARPAPAPHPEEQPC